MMYDEAYEEDKENKRTSQISNLSADQQEYEDAVSALLLAIQRYDVQGVDNILSTGLQAKHIITDSHKGRNLLHELIWHYVNSRSQGVRPRNAHLKVIDMLSLLLQSGVDINETDMRGQTVLHLACSCEDNSQIIRILLASGVQVNRRDAQQQTALHLVTSSGRLEDMSTLLDGGADANISDMRGFTPVHLAAKRKRGKAFIRTLANYGASLDAHTKSKSTKGPAPLHIAARFNRTENVKIMLAMGARPDIGDSAGQTPLHISAAHDMTGDTVATLLQAGASTSPRDSLYKEAPLHKAVKANRINNVIRLLHHRANPNSQDDMGDTALHVAAVRSKDMLMWRHLLLARGDATIPNRDGLSPFDVALKEKNMTAVAMMKQYDTRLDR